MAKTLIAFGCSFTYGDELVDPNITEPCISNLNDNYRNSHCYAGIVSDYYGLNFINTAFPGGSLESMRYALYWACKNHNLDDVVFLAGLTHSYRNSYFDENLNTPPWNRFRHGSWLKNDVKTSWEKLHHDWTVLCNCPEWEQFNLNQTVGYFENYNAILLPVFNNEPFFTSKYKTDFVIEDILEKQDLAPMSHPNERGHQKIANRLINYIDSVKIL